MKKQALENGMNTHISKPLNIYVNIESPLAIGII